MVPQSCHSCTFSTVDHPRTYGRTTLAQCTPLTKVKAGEQGDPLMPLLFAVGQDPALVATRLEANEWIFAYLDDIYILTRPERVGAVYATLQEELLRHAHIRIHGGKTHVWNVAGIEPLCAVPFSASLRHLTLQPECGVVLTFPHQ